eukprot:TRINITY_DN14001_c0_g1_i1.p1 TRINITY_DN14001_c0_g1~~TRINITY_DN14001_c0_g1_i1.p1  ORF type:complete len:663 (+),score=124.33 TRINITY_DN14001_c0_g1_i1:58-1989(+)
MARSICSQEGFPKDAPSVLEDAVDATSIDVVLGERHGDFDSALPEASKANLNISSLIMRQLLKVQVQLTEMSERQTHLGGALQDFRLETHGQLSDLYEAQTHLGEAVHDIQTSAASPMHLANRLVGPDGAAAAQIKKEKAAGELVGLNNGGGLAPKGTGYHSCGDKGCKAELPFFPSPAKTTGSADACEHVAASPVAKNTSAISFAQEVFEVSSKGQETSKPPVKKLSKSQSSSLENVPEASRHSLKLQLDSEVQLLQALQRAESKAEADRIRRLVDSKKSCCTRLAQRLRDRDYLENTAEAVVGFVIVLNSFYIGLSMDNETQDAASYWEAIDVTFSVIYLAEVLLKVTNRGWCVTYLGPDSFYTRFDTFVVVIDFLQLLNRHSGEWQMDGTPSAALFRFLRLMKLVRLMRLFRTEAFADLVKMIHGISGGSRTLFWSFVLFFVCIYVVALLHREMYGNKQVEGISESFNTVPTSLFTTFRCAFGDCTTPDGDPLFTKVWAVYGWPSAVGYMLFVFVLCVGVFNVISAIFVESTLAKAKQIAAKRKKQRFADFDLWSEKLSTLIRCLLTHAGEDVGASMSESIGALCKLDLPCEAVESCVSDTKAQEALEALDIDQDDFPILADICDPDNGGTLKVCDLVLC